MATMLSVQADAIVLAMGRRHWPKLALNGAGCLLYQDNGVFGSRHYKALNCLFTASGKRAFANEVFAGSPLKDVAFCFFFPP